ncbi:UPF0261-domain-containing protein [Amniculicola lignicola CBS 123094]|uniref:UPF0261-domain-containing protein n=1 Tax=Amniculicola lignicola CBS 123094 TaxID=1392246 RepID=A0A6A5W185_9PLEO|nr:UPF0261-domain-containing protein [Amniculicola lignicola CBS 123094]
MELPPAVIVMGPFDTKRSSILDLQASVTQTEVVPVITDIGLTPFPHGELGTDKFNLSISQAIKEDKTRNGPPLDQIPRYAVTKLIIDRAKEILCKWHSARLFHGIIAVGGSKGTVTAASIMRALPFGYPKLIVSTVPSSGTTPIFETIDIVHFTADMAVPSKLLFNILTNASAVICNTAIAYHSNPPCEFGLEPPESVGQIMGLQEKKRKVGITACGFTSPAVETIQAYLAKHYPQLELRIYYTTGLGGLGMERHISSGELDGVLDLTLTEVSNYITGGIMSSGISRLEAATRAGIPNVISLGALDITCFPSFTTVPKRYKANRGSHQFYIQDDGVAVMRTTSDEANAIGSYIHYKLLGNAKKLSMVEVWIPMGGLSLLSTPGGRFADAAADEVLFRWIRKMKRLRERDGIRIVADTRAINDPEFSLKIARSLLKMMGLRSVD